jgi:histidinol-phosphatase
MSPDLTLALELADAADAISLAAFRSRGLVVETKPDLSPVTEADRAVEHLLRARIGEERRRDAFFGEETGAHGDARRRWIVDPIDGTRNYARGVPVWATLIALEEDGVVTVGVVSAPALGRRWHAERGGGAWEGESRLHVSAIQRIEDAVLSLALEHPVQELAGRAWQARAYGDFWGHMLVAEGAADGAVDAIGLKVWDLAAVQVIVEEAGGRLTDIDGVARIDAGSAVTSNGLIHDALLAALRGGD